MASPTSHVIDVSKIHTMDDVLSNLKSLDGQLSALHLDQFQLFNAAYQVVTGTISQAVVDDYFQNPKFVEAFIVTFAGYYFRAVNDTARGDADLSPPWSKLNTYAAHKTAPVFVSLLLGANAHINNDLPQVLAKMMPGEEATELLGDVHKIDKLLMHSGKQIIGLFEEHSRFLNFLKDRFQFTYYRPAMYTILYWRIMAWKNYKKLKKSDEAMPKITKRSLTIADRLLGVAKLLST